MESDFNITKLPLDIDLETINVLKKLNKANKALAELKGISKTIPNSSILINTLILQEAKDSSEIENIITTHDELFKSDIDINNDNRAIKEVKNYSIALKKGFELIKKDKILILRHIIEIQKILEQNRAGIRKQMGTVLKNGLTGKTIYTPPQNYNTIMELLTNLENYINSDCDIDPLIKMAIIHYQFESIHPFYDGNGRTGRIINILYLVLNNLLDIPILYLSRYIIRNKNRYYKLLQDVRVNNLWEDWIIYILNGVEEISIETIKMIENIELIMKDVKDIIQRKAPKIYSKDLLETLFLHPYTKINSLVDHLNITRQTASKYLKKLELINVLKKESYKNSYFYVNWRLFDLFNR